MEHAIQVSSKIHTPQVERSDNHNPTLIILTLILVGCILGVLLAVFAIFCYRQKAKTRDKLKSLATGSVSEKEATVDYQVWKLQHVIKI
ncbi:uncharacterized protein LOC117112706 isoform X2 [Anneissia japonica]|uniref:uncharacterized protein LOC117112706 isoform X2 n=1 Tax=Anneissia japonica TaxID=1529436 RepID=UPI001425901B|nr:uncharacterized protein LOC117112706 isoform X2 [Anneissia japonica]